MRVYSMPVKRTLSCATLDVARLAGASIATVSCVVNCRRGVSPKLTGRFEYAIAALDYYPNEVAHSLKVNRTFAIGMIVPDVSNFFLNNVFQGVEPRPRQHSYSVVLCDSHEDPEEERDLLGMVLPDGAGGRRLVA